MYIINFKSRGVGHEFLIQALEQGHSVSLLARNPSALKMESPNLTVTKGDVMDSKAVESVMNGQ